MAASTGYFTGTAGDASRATALPSPFPPLDLCAPIGVPERSNFVAGNPLLLHTQ